MSDEDPVKSRVLSTLEVPDSDQQVRWRDFMAEVYYTLDIRCDSPLGLRGSLCESRFKDLRISTFEAQAHLVRRHGTDARADKSDDYVLLFPVSGSFLYEQRRETANIGNGNVVILKSSEPYSVLVSQGARNVTLKISAGRLREAVPWIDRLSAMSGFAAPEVVNILRNLSEDMMLIQSESHRLGLQTACFDILRMLVEEGRNSIMGQRLAGTAKQTILEGVQGYIRRHFRRTDLDIAAVAGHLGVSERYIQKILSNFNLSFNDMLRKYRLQEARLMIKSDQFRGKLQIGQIAFLCGFANQSYFSTIYRAEFGISPRDDHAYKCKNDS
ncbi:AraC family transcriptional regulator [Methylorubrum populi]|uniref:AraC family transcriptional regulator n=1 Tax=Methylorubrum populi TaxID=223967 RepID=UPI003F65C925